MGRCAKITEGELTGLHDRFDTGSEEGRGSDFEVSRLRIGSLLMRLIKTEEVLDVEYLSVRGLWAVSRDVQEAAYTDIWSSREGWAAGTLAVAGVLAGGSCSRGWGGG